MIRAMPERKRFFCSDVFPNVRKFFLGMAAVIVSCRLYLSRPRDPSEQDIFQASFRLSQPPEKPGNYDKKDTAIAHNFIEVLEVINLGAICFRLSLTHL